MKVLFAGIVAALMVASAGGAQTTRQASTPRQSGTLVIAGQADQAPVVQISGKSYVDVESFARLTHASVQYQGNQTILTLPPQNAPSAPASTSSSSQASRPPQLSEAFLTAEIEALTQLREWRVSMVNAVQNNYPVTEDWVGKLRRSADAKLQLAVAAAHTDPDHQALQLLQNVFANMQQMSEQFVTQHADARYTPTDSFVNNSQDQKILVCERALVSMAATKQFQDEPACH